MCPECARNVPFGYCGGVDWSRTISTLHNDNNCTRELYRRALYRIREDEVQHLVMNAYHLRCRAAATSMCYFDD